MSSCYLNGEFVQLENARIGVLDRGFLFGDAVYEVIPVRAGQLFALDEHLARLGRSLLAIGIENPYGTAEWAALLERLLTDNGAGVQSVYVQVTRGEAPDRDHVPEPGLSPTVFAMVRFGPEPRELLRVAAVTSDDTRWARCDIKSTSLLANVLLRAEAQQRDAWEAILLRDGRITEGAASNVFVVHGARVRTPPLSSLILPGVTRALLIDALAEAGFDIAEGEIRADELADADEIWLTSSTRDLLSVATLDGAPVGATDAYPLARRAYACFQDYVSSRVTVGR